MSKLVTEWGKPKSKLKTAKGTVTYKAWCESERSRINGHGDHVRITEDGNGLIALTR